MANELSDQTLRETLAMILCNQAQIMRNLSPRTELFREEVQQRIDNSLKLVGEQLLTTDEPLPGAVWKIFNKQQQHEFRGPIRFGDLAIDDDPTHYGLSIGDKIEVTWSIKSPPGAAKVVCTYVVIKSAVYPKDMVVRRCELTPKKDRAFTQPDPKPKKGRFNLLSRLS